MGSWSADYICEITIDKGMGSENDDVMNSCVVTGSGRCQIRRFVAHGNQLQ